MLSKLSFPESTEDTEKLYLLIYFQYIHFLTFELNYTKEEGKNITKQETKKPWSV